MINKFRAASNQIFVTIFIGLIVVGFVFTGYQSVQGTPDTVAKVGDLKISYSEYQRVLDQQVQFFSYQFGGKPLTTKQINDFGLKPRALNQLINQKLFLKMADHLNIIPSDKEVITEVKKIPAFLTNEKFDVLKYKNVLKANNLTPSDFEMRVKEDLKLRKTQQVLKNYPFSSKLAAEIKDIRKKKVELKIISVNRETVQKFVKIKPGKIQEFLKKDKNKDRVRAYFSAHKTSDYDKPLQVKASHILIKGTDEKSLKKVNSIKKSLTTKNFSTLANKHSEDPGNQKTKGGELGWFSKGRMVPEFEKAAFGAKKNTIVGPVKTTYGYHLIYVRDRKEAYQEKLENVEKEIAKSFLQKESSVETDSLMKNISSEISKVITNDKKVSVILKKYDLNESKTHLIDPLSDVRSTQLTDKEFKELLTSQKGDIKTYTSPLLSKIVFVSDVKVDEKIDLENITSKYEQKYLQQELESALNNLKDIYPTKSYLNRF